MKHTIFNFKLLLNQCKRTSGIMSYRDGRSGGRCLSDRPGGPCQPHEPSQYATLNRKFRTLDHPTSGGRRAHHLEPGNAHTLGSRKAARGDGPGQYSTLSKKCKTLESSDFY